MRRTTPGTVVRALLGAALTTIALAPATPWAAPVDEAAAPYTYTVQEGDTLISIAERLLQKPTDWPRLQALNHVANPRRIPVGTTVRIPVAWLKTTEMDARIVEVSGRAWVFDPPAAGPLAMPRGSSAAPAGARSGGVAARAPGAAQARPTASLPQPGTNTPPARAGLPLRAGQALRTEDDGYVTVQLADGSVLRVQSGSTVQLQSSRRHEGAGFFAQRLLLLQGRLEALVEHLTGGAPRFEVQTPQTVLGVRGTDFRIATGETGAPAEPGAAQKADAQANAQASGSGARSRAEVLGGSVQLAGRRTAVLLPAGTGSRVDDGGQPTPPVALLPAPDLSGLPKRFERVVVKLPLPPQPGALAWRAQFALDPGFRQVRGEVSGAGPELKIGDLPDADYHVRVRAIDANGLEGRDAQAQITLKARPEPPIVQSPAPGAKLRGTAARLSWTEHPAATAYRLQVAEDEGFTRVVHEALALREPAAELALPQGRYHWRVATTATATTGSADPGPWGDASSFQLLPLPAAPQPPAVGEKTLRFNWAGEPGQRFAFQMAADPTFTRDLQEQALNEPSLELPRPERGGRWFVRYRATDPDGFVGPWTAPQAFELPSCVQDRYGHCVHSRDGQPAQSAAPMRAPRPATGRSAR